MLSRIVGLPEISLKGDQTKQTASGQHKVLIVAALARKRSPGKTKTHAISVKDQRAKSISQ